MNVPHSGARLYFHFHFARVGLKGIRFVAIDMSTETRTVWPKGHRADEPGPDGRRRYEVTGLWTGSLPGFVNGCTGDSDVHLERRGERTFVVVE